MHTIRSKSYRNLKKVLQVSAQSCHPQRFANTKEYKHQHTNLGSEMYSIKILKILKL